ncbi:MAG: hypothetical protein HOE65_17650, partial [Rhodospirillales bacterium]|nr:hypothetical protein [Rhodospirillales bacterium]
CTQRHAVLAATTTTYGIPKDETLAAITTAEAKAINLTIPDGIVLLICRKLSDEGIG